MITILYVDDEESLLELGKIFLERNGQFAVDIITSASEALTLIGQKPYDAIISDYQMPEMDGIELLKHVRASGKTIPFILFTGRGREEVVIQALNEGADFYLQKGGSSLAQFTELAYKIRHAVQKRWAETRLRDHERREADIINFLPDATFAIDKKGVIIAWNRAMEEMTGARPAEVLGKDHYEHAFALYHKRRPMLADLILTPDPQFEEAEYLYTHHDQRTLMAETHVERPNGTRLHIWGKASILLDEKGDVAGAIESIRDITEQKLAESELQTAYDEIAATEEEMRSQYLELVRSERQLRESEEKYRELVETANSIIIKWDRSGIITFANEFALQFFGYTREELIGRSVMETIVPATESGSEKDLTRMILDILNQPDVYVVNENENVCKNGTRVWIRWHNKPIFDNRGEFAGLFSIGTDVTGRREIETALRESAAKYQGIFAAESDGIAVVDRETGIILECNDALAFMHGYLKEELPGQPITVLSAESDATSAAIAGATPFIRDRYHKKKDGNVFPVEITVNPTRLQGREVLIGAIRDVTELRRSEEALQQANRSLALLTNVTRHDINNQLVALNGFLELLHEKVRDPALEEYFVWISQVSTRISSMIQFASTYETVRKTHPLWQDIRALAETTARQVSLGKVIIKNEIPAGIEVFADPLFLKVFYNLVDNALRYGEKLTFIRFSFIERDNAGGVIVCEDDGEGVPEASKEKIFDRGYGKNTGLGLFLAREILSLTGITVKETGEPGKGARFEITVPRDTYRFTGKS
ncbi:multi-sensor signal transduction histidine kinase [Methanoregula boonei 6A8]|uniref:histidine kinase n=1 Tax=Methanoregula boonei (strain DSM 21154 / JCM 14090 / 6A8) TaxID=456442 RepID=A7I8C0_METB6|nr:PAS domain S-box protein [Methanoregula boonei]ABS55981.1 multi-sensor signal transduction histidine kinase [Methanoregula boonei 6A8]